MQSWWSRVNQEPEKGSVNVLPWMSVHIYMVGPRLRQVSQQVQSRTKQYLVTTKPFSPQARLLQKRCVLHESMATVKRRKTSRHQCHRRVYRTIRRLLETGRLPQ